MSRGTTHLSFALASIMTCLALAACDPPRVEEHQIDKGVEEAPPRAQDGTPRDDEDAAPDPAATPSDQPEAGRAADAAPWVVPEGWLSIPGERPMRLATFEIPDEAGAIEVAVTRFPGNVGGELANVNRWRGQMGLAPVSEAELGELLDRFEFPGFSGYAVRIRGAESHMFAVGVHERSADRTWFVRATAAPEAMDRAQSEILAFARSIAGSDGAGGG